MNKIISMVFLSFIALQLPAQVNDSASVFHSIGLSSGVNQVKDENLHPKVSKGIITEFTYGFEKRKKAWTDLHFNVSYSRVKNKLEDLSKSVNLRLNLSYCYGFRIAVKKKFMYYLGPELSLGYNASFYPNFDDSHLYWADNISLGIGNRLRYRLRNNNELCASVDLPLFSIFNRPELYRFYKIDQTDFAGIVKNLNSDFSAAHLTNVFFLKLNAEYRFPAGRKNKEALFYAFSYTRIKHNDSNPFSQLLHHAGIKFLL